MPSPLLFAAFTLALLSPPAAADAPPLRIVAAENFYGGVASEIAGGSATVIGILTNPNQDPHEFTTNAGTARAVADADIVIYSGIGYDLWIERLLAARGRPGREVIDVSRLIGAKMGDNPHIWYDPRSMVELAHKLVALLSEKNPSQAGAYQKRLAAFEASLRPLLEKIAELKRFSTGVKVTATEPVFGHMARTLGFQMLNEPFQVKIMNDAEPSASETAAFEKSLVSQTVKILFYNSQVTDPTTERIKAVARQAGVPIVGVTETEPVGEKSYATWMLRQLDAVQAALDAKRK